MSKQNEEPEDKAPGESGDPAPLTVDISPPDEDDDGDDDAPAASGDRKSRRGGYRALRDQLVEMRSQAAARDREIEDLRRRVSQPAPAPRAEPKPDEDPDTREAKSMWDQQQTVLRALSVPGLPAEEQQRLTSQYQDLEAKRVDKLYAAAAKRHAPRQQQPQAPDESAYARVVLQGKYPKLFEDDIMGDEANLEARKLARAKRVPINIAILEEAATTVYARHGLGGRPAPTDTERARYAGTAGRPGSSARQSYTPTKNVLGLARSYTEHRKGLTDEQRIKVWVDEVGKPNGLV